MYKKLGLQIDIGDKLRELLHKTMANLVCYYKSSDPNFLIAENNKRQGHRAPVDLNLPEHLDVNIWIYIREYQRHVKVRVKDISVGGACIILPFSDDEDCRQVNQIVDLVIEVGKQAFSTTGTIRTVSRIHPSTKQKRFLEKKYLDKIDQRQRLWKEAM